MNIMNTGIYSIRNKIDGKLYIGSAYNFRTRFAQHLSSLRNNKHHSITLQRAWDKHGENSFVFEKLLVCEKDMVIFYEQKVMDLYDSSNPKHGYNIAPKAGNTAGVKVSDETRKKNSDAQTGRKMKPEDIAKVVAFHTGRKRSKETCDRISAALKGKTIHTDESKRKISEALTGRKRKPFTDEHRKKISDAKKGQTVSEETKNKLRVSSSGKTHTVETREKLSLKLKGKIKSPDHLAKIAKANTGKIHSEESKKKMSEKMKGKKHSEESKKKMSIAQKGKVVTDETRERMSKAQTGKKRNQESIAKSLATRAATLARRKAQSQQESLT